MRTKWIIDNVSMNKDPLLRKKWEDALAYNAIEHYFADYITFQEKQDYGNFDETIDPIVLYGCVQFIKKCDKRFFPGAYGYTNNRNCHVYMNKISPENLLNDDYVMAPFGEFKRNADKFFKIFDSKCLFVRPDSGDKVFAGSVLWQDDLEIELNSMDKITSATDETIIVIASPKDIKAEFRFVICKNEVIAGSEYRWDGKLDIRADYDPDCHDLAMSVARNEWQLDDVYTCDVALTPDGPKVIELNSFSSAGLYMCDYREIVKRVSELAQKSFDGDEI